jgi:hypothetical protein
METKSSSAFTKVRSVGAVKVRSSSSGSGSESGSESGIGSFGCVMVLPGSVGIVGKRELSPFTGSHNGINMATHNRILAPFLTLFTSRQYHY